MKDDNAYNEWLKREEEDDFFMGKKPNFTINDLKKALCQILSTLTPSGINNYRVSINVWLDDRYYDFTELLTITFNCKETRKEYKIKIDKPLCESIYEFEKWLKKEML